ncbi:MAG: hypothetical protein PHW62_00270 [Candidatus Ratteibacteria bacterium]|nr:hypothetical protein [Candidatus Ratteibacteria bacterium]
MEKKTGYGCGITMGKTGTDTTGLSDSDFLGEHCQALEKRVV